MWFCTFVRMCLYPCFFVWQRNLDLAEREKIFWKFHQWITKWVSYFFVIKYLSINLLLVNNQLSYHGFPWRPAFSNIDIVHSSWQCNASEILHMNLKLYGDKEIHHPVSLKHKKGSIRPNHWVGCLQNQPYQSIVMILINLKKLHRLSLGVQYFDACQHK